MTPIPELLEGMAALFAYPDPAYKPAIGRVEPMTPPEALPSLRGFADAVLPLSIGEMEELYIRTFDMNPKGALDIGWHLFGEDYARGEFLVKLRGENRRYGIEERDELPDNLAVVLRLISKMPAGEAMEMTQKFLAPALRKIREGIDGGGNPFALLVDSLLACLQVPASEAAVPQEAPYV